MICYLISILVSICIASYHSSADRYKKFVSEHFSKLLSVVTLILGCFFITNNIVKANDKSYELLDYMTYYFGSTIALMGKIVENPDLCHTPFVGYFGEKTFNGLYKSLFKWGLVDNLPCDRVWMSMESSVLHRAGNEYTFFCAPYIDFGFMGTLVFVFLFYLFFNVFYYWYIKTNSVHRMKYFYISLYIWLYTLVAMSFYQDTIRAYSSPHNFLYIIYMYIIYKMFVRIKMSR